MADSGIDHHFCAVRRIGPVPSCSGDIALARDGRALPLPDLPIPAPSAILVPAGYPHSRIINGGKIHAF